MFYFIVERNHGSSKERRTEKRWTEKRRTQELEQKFHSESQQKQRPQVVEPSRKLAQKEQP
ncbi:MAG TPA: hypothetical protein VJ852_09405 [Gemmatimonadaceae bacterium]|nr:hypothetical protein [Gemmatimonadaceae bacterium]